MSDPQNVTYITNPAVPTTVIGGVPIPPKSSFPPASSTVTIITGFFNTPIVNINGIIPRADGTFVVPKKGNYIITATFDYAPDASTLISSISGSITTYIYRVDTLSNIFLLAVDSRNVYTSTTYPKTNTFVTLTTATDLRDGDRIFFAATTSLTPYMGYSPIVTVGTDSKFSIMRTYTDVLILPHYAVPKQNSTAIVTPTMPKNGTILPNVTFASTDLILPVV